MSSPPRPQARTAGPVAQRIRSLREARGLSQRRLAELAGMKDRTQVVHLEGSAGTPTLATLRKLARALNVELVELLKEEERPTG